MAGCVDKLRISNTLVREALAEFLGTFTLMIFGDGSVAQYILSNKTLGTAMSIHWSWGIGVTLGVFVAGGVSGGHLNPAVTLALSALKGFPLKKVPIFIMAQYLGSYIASAVLFFVYTDALDHYDNGTRHTSGELATAGIWATYPADYVSTWNCLGDQILSTGLLMMCILAITDERNSKPPLPIIAISVGFSVFVIGMTFHLNCGYAINPARDLAPRIFTALAGWGVEPFSYRNYNYFWVPVVGPHVGAIVGGLFYQLCVGLHWPPENTQSEATAAQKGIVNDSIVLEEKDTERMEAGNGEG